MVMDSRDEPAAIDLDDLAEDFEALVAEVEALRARVVELEGDMYVKRVHDAEARVVKLQGALEPFADENAWSGWSDHKGAYLTASFRGLGKPWVWAQDALGKVEE